MGVCVCAVVREINMREEAGVSVVMEEWVDVSVAVEVLMCVVEDMGVIVDDWVTTQVNAVSVTVAVTSEDCVLSNLDVD
jgi:hypothetical protein